MSKDKSAPDQPRASSEPEGGSINIGVAIVGFLLCFLSGAAIMWGIDSHHLTMGGSSSDSAAGAWSDEESPVPVSSKDPMWGNRNAPVTIVQFSDFQCPYCSKVEPSIDQLKQTYGPDKLRVIWKNKPLPFHPNAKPAAEAAMGVFALEGNDAFWKFHDTAFKNQSALSPASYEKWAQAAGVKDLAEFKAGLAAHTWADKVDKDDAIATQVGRAAARRRPSSTASSSPARSRSTSSRRRSTRSSQKAQAKIAAGTPKDRIYVVMTKENKTNAPPADAKKDQPEKKEDTTTVFKVPVGSSPVQGNPQRAPITIVEFSDFQCPFCSRVEPTLKQVKEKYGDKVRLVWKNEPLPFHPRAEPAAEVAMEARAEKGDKGFWDVHDRLFASQPKLEDADLEKVATDAGLSLDKVARRDEEPQVQGRDRRRRRSRRRHARRAERRTSSSTAGASSARSRSRSSPRSSTTRSPRPRRSSPRAPRRRSSTTCSSRTARAASGDREEERPRPSATPPRAATRTPR